jgi:hypothetical protein
MLVLSCLAQIWATWASDGLGRAGALQFVVPSGGGGDDLGGIGTAVRPAYCSRAVGALRVRLGLVGLVWVWSVLATLSGRRPQLGGGGGLLRHGCRAAGPCPNGVVYHHLTGHTPLISKRQGW